MMLFFVPPSAAPATPNVNDGNMAQPGITLYVFSMKFNIGIIEA